MAVNSSMLPLGTIAPSFNLIDVCTNKSIALSDFQNSKATVIMFICNHCPYVIHIQEKLIAIANEYIAKGISFIAINSNDVELYPDDSPLQMKKIASEKKYPFPYLFDETQEVAKAYHAACTPDFYIFDQSLKCVYRGRFDDSTPRNQIEPSGRDLIEALDAVLAGEMVNPNQKASIGCSIKWKKLEETK